MFPQLRLQVYPMAVEIVGIQAANIEFPPGGFITIALCYHVGSLPCGGKQAVWLRLICQFPQLQRSFNLRTLTCLAFNPHSICKCSIAGFDAVVGKEGTLMKRIANWPS